MALATGQITIVDLNDVTLQGFLSSSQPKIQLTNNAGSVFTPNWGSSNLVIDAEVYQMGDSTNYALVAAKATSIIWSYKLAGDVSFTIITSGSNNFTIGGTNGSRLTVAANKMTITKPSMTVRAVIQYAPQSGMTPIPYTLEVDYGLTRQGEQGNLGPAAVTAVLSNESITLAASSSGSVNSFAGAVSTMTIFEGATDVSGNWTYTTAVSGVTITGTDTRTVTITAMSADTGYIDITASRSGYSPITKRVTVNKSRAGIDAVAKGISISGPQVFSYNREGALTSAATIVLNVERMNVASFTVTASSNGGAYGAVTSTANQIVVSGDTITVYPGATIWGANKTISIKVAGEGVSDSISLYKVYDGAASKSVSILADSYFFKKGASGSVTPGYITLTAQKQNLTGTVTWSGATFYTTTGLTTTTTTGDTVYLKNDLVGSASITASMVGGFTDKITVSTVEEGLSALTVINRNEASTVPASATGTVSSFAGTSNLISVFEGASQLTFVTGTPTAGQWKMTPTATSVVAPAATVSSGSASVANITALNADAGNILYTITGKRLNGTNFTLTTTQTITKSKAGAESVTAMVWAPDGDTFVNTLTTNPFLPLNVILYEGVTAKTPTSILWFAQNAEVSSTGHAKYNAKGGLGWESLAVDSAGNFTGGTSATLNVYAAFVPSLKVFKAVATYGGKNYADTVIIRDYTDPYQVVLSSSNGETFIDGNISTVITATVRQNGEEVDPDGTIFTYTWSKTLIDGSPAVGWTPTLFETQANKITVGSADVTKKATFTCEVSKV